MAVAPDPHRPDSFRLAHVREARRRLERVVFEYLSAAGDDAGRAAAPPADDERDSFFAAIDRRADAAPADPAALYRRAGVDPPAYRRRPAP